MQTLIKLKSRAELLAATSHALSHAMASLAAALRLNVRDIDIPEGLVEEATRISQRFAEAHLAQKDFVQKISGAVNVDVPQLTKEMNEIFANLQFKNSKIVDSQNLLLAEVEKLNQQED